MTLRSLFSVSLGLALIVAVFGLPPPSSATALTSENMAFHDAGAADVSTVQVDHSDDAVGASITDINNENLIGNGIDVAVLLTSNPFDKDLTQSTQATTLVSTLENLDQTPEVVTASAWSLTDVINGAMSTYQLAPKDVADLNIAPNPKVEEACRDVHDATLNA